MPRGFLVKRYSSPLATGISYPLASTIVPKVNLNDSDNHPIALINKKHLGLYSDEDRSDSSSSEQDVNQQIKSNFVYNGSVSTQSSSSSLIYNYSSVSNKEKVTKFILLLPLICIFL
jgi:hypothetical protein